MSAKRFMRSFIVVMMLLICVNAAAYAQDTHPAQPLLEAWLSAINANDPQGLEQFITQNYSEAALSAIPTEIRVAIESDLMRSRPWSLHSFTPQSESQASAILYSELTETWVQVMIQIGADSPAKIEMMGVMPTNAPADAPQTAVSDDQLPAYLDPYLARLADAGLFSGAVLVAKDGEVVYEGAFGMADRENATPNQTDTKFNLGSMNKMFTAVAIAQLVEQGKIAFDDLVSEYLSDLPAEIAEKVTIAHLLSHTSGLAEYFSSPDWPLHQESADTVSGYVSLFIDQPLQFEPGSQHQYSNSNFITLGAIIEAVSGQDYFEYVREYIYEPAGMTATDAYAKDAEVPNLAIGYTSSDASGRPTPGEQHPNTDLLPMRGSPAGGGYSTIHESLSICASAAG